MMDTEELRYRDFVSRFDVLTIPACDIGMRLLLKLKDANPQIYEQAGQYHWSYWDNPEMETVPEWAAFANHCTSCEACNAC